MSQPLVPPDSRERVEADVLQDQPEAGDSLRPFLARLQQFSAGAAAASKKLSVWFAEHQSEIAGVLEVLASAGASVAHPDNWETLTPTELERLQQIAIDDEIALAWVPNADVVRAVIALSDRDQRCACLVVHRAAVLDDCEAAVNFGETTPEQVYGEVKRLALRCIAAARAGHDEAAQALASSLVTAIVEGVLGFASLRGAEESYRRLLDNEAGDLLLLRIAVLFGATAHVVTHTNEGLPGFNRHATGHGKLGSFGPSEMLEAIMLVSAWVREYAFLAPLTPALDESVAKRWGPKVLPSR